MFPGFFVGTVFLFLLVRSLVWGRGYGFRRHYAGYRPWGGRGVYEPSVGLWDEDDPWPVRQHRRREAEEQNSRYEPPHSANSYVSASPRDTVDEAVDRFVRSLRDRLGATRSQETAFAAAVARLREATDDVRTRLNEARDDAARALRADAFDEVAFAAASQRIDQAVLTMREAAREALIDVHDVLDARQRAILGNLIESPRESGATRVRQNP